MNWNEFVTLVNGLRRPRILELGTKRSKLNIKKGTIHKDQFRGYGKYVGTDVEAGMDVDVIADAHKLSEVLGEESFDVIISCSTFEHFKYPQLAAHEIMKTLRVGGLLFIQTHQAFPLHAYPYDYCRFSKEALEALFPKKMGFEVVDAWYEFPATVVSERDPGTKNSPAFLNSNLYGKKSKETPKEYQYEL